MSNAAVNLDDLDLDALDLDVLDPAGMLRTVEASGQQWAGALGIAAEAQDPRYGRLRNVVVCGMGGSGIAADVARVVAFHHGNGVPVVPAKGYALPSWIGPRTLVIAVSYSGNTEETLACIDQAVAAGTQVAAVTSGGRLAELAADRGWVTAMVPGGGQPRANLPYLCAPVLGMLEAAGVVGGVRRAIADTPRHVEEAAEAWSHAVPTADNPVKSAAVTLAGLAPVFYGGSGFPAVLAQRGKCQVNENANRPAFHAELPELDHNEVVGWDQLPELTRGCGLVSLRDPHEHPQVAKRFSVTLDLIASAFGASVRHDLQGDNGFVRFARGVLFVDLLSVYLAFASGVDPTPVDRIGQLKRRIAD